MTTVLAPFCACQLILQGQYMAHEASAQASTKRDHHIRGHDTLRSRTYNFILGLDHPCAARVEDSLDLIGAEGAVVDSDLDN